MSTLQWILKALRRLFHNNALCSSLRSLLFLWNFIKLQLQKLNKKCGKLEGREKGQDEQELSIHLFYTDGKNNAAEPFQSVAESTVIVCASQDPDPSVPPQAAVAEHSHVTFHGSIQEDTSMVENLSTIAHNHPLEKQLSDIYPHFWPISPELVDRYNGYATVPTDPTEYPIKPLTTSFGHQDSEGWREFLHPEGPRYFCYLEKNVYTDANILDQHILSTVMDFVTEIFKFCDEYDVRLPPTANLVLAPDIGETHSTCAYYFVDHLKRSIFWLDHLMFSGSEFYICYTVEGVTDPSHICHEIEAQYWYHCNQYPHSFGLTPVLVDELRDIIMHWIGDSLTSMTGTAPYPITKLQSMLSLANSFRKNTATGGCVSAYSRLMHVFCRHRFIHFHGQPGARLDFDKSVHYTLDNSLKSWVIKLLSPLMFDAPDIYYNTLDKIWVDRMLHMESWEKFIDGMKGEWQGLNILGTVLLTTNVSFLAIQSIDEDTVNPQRSPAEIASYLSVVMTLGSIMLGLFLTRKICGTDPKDSSLSIAQFLTTWSPKEHGRNGVRIALEVLAILCSVPYALLMWGVFLFMAGFSYMCFNNANDVVRSLTGIVWFIVFILALWSTFSLVSWDHIQSKSFWQAVFLFIRWVVFDLPRKIRFPSRQSFRDIFSRGSGDMNNSQAETYEMSAVEPRAPQQMQDQSQRPGQSSNQNGGGMMRQLLSFFGRGNPTSHDMTRTAAV
ncbi:hypothetical protein VKT23_019606 [Stygiomarasmius scandens]|uniref:Uncharacterized protein n=1 Tax=Marasmiellus scandens TaxID=2682957 RepID=A0ABR1IL51_9AGAR